MAMTGPVEPGTRSVHMRASRVMVLVAGGQNPPEPNEPADHSA
jgi:hypothetical protein